MQQNGKRGQKEVEDGWGGWGRVAAVVVVDVVIVEQRQLQQSAGCLFGELPDVCGLDELVPDHRSGVISRKRYRWNIL